MHPIFAVTIEEIRNLTDEQSRELVARLCRVELKNFSVSQSAVSWGGDQRAKDGGVDVMVDVDPPLGLGGYVKSDRSAFQVKAEKFGGSKIPGEMAPRGVMRPAILDLANTNGAYIIVSTRDSLSASSLSARIKAMDTCLTQYGLSGKVIVDFYDCRKIADWAEQYPAIVNWMKYVLGKPIIGWQPYSPWAYLETDIEAEYLLDDRVKVFIPNADNGIDVLSAINHLRSDLGKNVSVRVVGLSGVGKTRLVQALFDKRLNTEAPAIDSENVIYTDLSNNPTPQPIAIVEALISCNSDSVVIVDNCGQDVHQRLTEIIKRPGCNIRLVTVEYDIRDDLPEGTICYRIEGSSEEVIKELLKRRYKFLSNSDLDKIVEFSDGNARVAYALASSTETTGELARLRDSELFKRLFVQKHKESDQLLRSAETASLLYSFDGEDLSPSSEIQILATLADVSVISFSQHISELYRRGLVQQRGQWRAVLPHAIANRLAMRAIEAFPKNLLITSLVEKATDRMARSFSRRLGYLHESKAVNVIVKDWLCPQGRFGDLTSQNDIGRQVFKNIAPVDQDAAMAALERAVLDSGFISIDNSHRSYFARIARLLAYDAKLFDRAVDVLLQFVLAEPVDYNRDSTCDLLKSLFYCHLSGTEALSDQRSRVVRELLFSANKKRQQVGFSLLDSGLEAWHFSSFYEFDFGARKRGYGWCPRTHDDVRSWYKPFIGIAVEAGKSKTACGKRARALLGKSVRALCVRAGLSKDISVAAKELLPIDGWPEGWLGIRSVLQWDKEKISEEFLREVRELEQLLAPRDLKTKIGAKVLARGCFPEDLGEEEDDNNDPPSRYHRAEQEAEDLGKIAATDQELISELLSDLLHASANSKVLNFGFGVGQVVNDAAMFVAQVRQIIADAKPGSMSLIFLRGVISGWHKAKPEQVLAFLDEALYDEIWVKWFPELQLRVPLDEVGYKRLLTSLEKGKTPTWQYKYLAWGRVSDPLTVEQISALVTAVASKDDDGLSVAIDLLAMVIHSVNEKDIYYRRELVGCCASFLRHIDWIQVNNGHGRIDHDIDVILNFTLAASCSKEMVPEMLQRLIEYERLENIYFSRGRGKFLAPFFKYYPLQSLDAIYTSDDDGQFSSALRMVSISDSNQGETAIRAVPLEKLIEWCEISPTDRYLFAAETCCLFEQKSEGDAEVSLSEVTKMIIAKAPDKETVLNIIIKRFSPRIWHGSLAAILRSRLPLLLTLNPSHDKELELKIKAAEKTFEKYIIAKEAFEEKNERRQTESFE